VRIGDFPLGPHDPLAHRRLGHQEGARDFGRRQPSKCAQRQGHPGRHVERRVAAGEDQPQSVVNQSSVVRHIRLAFVRARPKGRVADQPGRAPGGRMGAAHPVNRPAPGRSQ
jgi:hypothetical protein